MDDRRPAVSGFDPDAPDPLWGPGDGSSVPPHDDPGTGELPADVWVDPFADAGPDEWVEPVDDLLDDTPTARADRAYGRAVDPATPAAALRAVADDLTAWDVEGLIAEAAVLAGAVDTGPVATAERPEVVVLRSLLRHPNRPADLADVLLRGWLQDPGARSPWPAVVASGLDGPLQEDLLVTAVTEALDAARSGEPPAWSLVLTAAAAARPDGAAVLDLLALVGFPHEQPVRLWTDAEAAAKGLPGGVRAQARTGAEALGWDGRRLLGLPGALARAVHDTDRRRRDSSFTATLELCPHGPVVLTPTSVALPSAAAGPRPYVALIVGSHPVFRLKRDWPDRSDGATGTVWSWDGPQLLESRGLGCGACRRDEDRGKRYLLSTGSEVADVPLSLVRRVIDVLDEESAAEG
jgi:hypothetical protein